MYKRNESADRFPTEETGQTRRRSPKYLLIYVIFTYVLYSILIASNNISVGEVNMQTSFFLGGYSLEV